MSDDKVAIPTNTQDNPLLHKLTPRQFDASVKFYEADHQLLQDDRKVIADDLQNVVFTTALYGYGAAATTFLIPTAYYNYTQRNSVNRHRVRPVPGLIKRPFISFLTGLTFMLLTNQQVCKYKFLLQIQEAEQTSEKRAQVWKAMDYHQASLFYLYYRKTAENPDFIVQDPRLFNSNSMHKVHYDPPKDEHFTSTFSLAKGEELSHWDQIRMANGFGVEQSKWSAIREGKNKNGESPDANN